MANDDAMTTEVLEPRDTGRAILRGLLCRCPNCGQGPLFTSYLKVTPKCRHCGEAMDGHRADDAPPYITMFIVGHVVVGLNLAVERAAEWPMWLHFVVWIGLGLVMSLGMLQPVKGAMVALQWANRMHGFDPAGDYHDRGFGDPPGRAPEPGAKP